MDGPRVEALRDAAQAAKCEIALALAEVHQTWSAYAADHWDGRRGYGQWSSWDDDEGWEDGTSGEANYELEELIESEVTLGHWTDLSGGPMDPISTDRIEDAFGVGEDLLGASNLDAERIPDARASGHDLRLTSSSTVGSRPTQPQLSSYTCRSLHRPRPPPLGVLHVSAPPEARAAP